MDDKLHWRRGSVLKDLLDELIIENWNSVALTSIEYFIHNVKPYTSLVILDLEE